MSVIYEILFIMGVLLILILNLIFSYSKNLKLLFNNQTRVLEQVQAGDLSNKVAVATSDEFGVIAGHTNHMIDGLRHRFELVQALQLAEEVQQNLLPSKSPYLKGYDISGLSLYCDETGGDYYDYFLLPDGKFGIVVADVCGHGVGAAMLMTSIRAYMVSAIENYSDPAHLLGAVNRNLAKDCAVSGNFASVFFLEIDPRERSLQWVRAGHEAAIHFSCSTGKFNELSGPGIVLGIDGAFQFTNQSKTGLKQGDIFLIGTDGIPETTNEEGELFGKEMLKQVIADNAHHSSQKMVRDIVENVQQYRNGLSQEDDITLVAIKIED